MPAQSSKPVGVLVAQLGTPDAPTPEALRRYLKVFLSDTRVVDLNPLLWQIILRLIVLRTRPARSAALYRRVWMEDGSPLLVYSRKQAEGLAARLGDAFQVRLGMRYGNPSIAEALQAFEADGVDRVLVFSMFPQFSSSTTSSIYDAVNQAAGGRRCPLFLERKRFFPTLRFVPPYYDHPLYIDALRHTLEAEIATLESPPQHVLFSFHSIPERFVNEGDPYQAQCETTARLTADALGLPSEAWSLSYQSKFGREPWLGPSTEQTLETLAAQGTDDLLVACPGFTVDGLETLDEIGNEGAERFHEKGGGRLHLAACLNDDAAWLDAMARMVQQEAAGWV